MSVHYPVYNAPNVLRNNVSKTPAECTIANSNNQGVTCTNGSYDAQVINANSGFQCDTGYWFEDGSIPHQCLPCPNITYSNNVALSCNNAAVCVPGDIHVCSRANVFAVLNVFRGAPGIGGNACWRLFVLGRLLPSDWRWPTPW